MSLPLKQTLGEIRSAIQTRLGFGMAGQAGIVNSGLIDDMIRSAQNQLYEQFEWVELKSVYERSTGAEQAFYDYPVDCSIEGISSISVLWAGKYVPLKEGIELHHRSANVGTVPCRYERRDQLEVWPVPTTANYTLRFEYKKVLLPLIDNSDRTTIPSEIVKLHALANAKSHYRQPDAEMYANQLNAMLEKLKAKHRSRTVWESNARVQTPYDSVSSDQDV